MEMEYTFIEKSSKSLKNPFTPEEDRRLSDLVKFFPRKRDINWNYIAQQMHSRNPRQCKDRWTNYLDSRINKKEFTPEENHFLLVKVEEIGKKWRKIASLMHNRTDVSLKSQYRKLMRRHASRENVYNLCMEAYSTRRKKRPTNNTKKEDQLLDLSIPDSNEFQINFDDLNSLSYESMELDF
ncbi:Myb-like DNA-binding domain containing protein [Trichomonas vaginalis G3]|uniref:Myb-like DNA-binding domain containing protein n=1 Tax=Trichomonas vaginalis (strain ATCC PRA-98 / G3) TaxID=412133 RepID=A2DP54_TRIV3|nr:RNA polymerase II transcription regulator recruiting protein [Trichomonas vaginalis G3]EAY17754.1 Myb-like DNA-binding domain containing protein [Trichomonas vaginalis G3]KAI5484237.1 RNA polymerase II transcription regulator recruiting protein [Trichomonas vaginalis G3]|eukprot:XP_001329889.1 Myb-like DNA-binding domain containing protein [Trichomonas vaginalis G3]